MTDSDPGDLPPWFPVLRDVARASGHELRNALNALLVNLEVVRSRAPDDESVGSFIRQAVEQSEEAARLAEGTIALLNLLVGAIGDGRASQIRSAGPRGARIEATEAEAQRVVRALDALARRTGLDANASVSAVILSIPESSTKTIERE